LSQICDAEAIQNNTNIMNITTMENDEIHEIVKEAYAKRASGCGGLCGNKERTTSTCCSTPVVPSAETQRDAEKMGYSKQDVENAPEESNLGLGCGAPLTEAAVNPGDVVLDLGSGAGFDVFLASREVGEKGLVIGVDMTPAMVLKALANTARRDYKNVEFRLGKIEALPVDSDSVDVIISNCVINLSPDKQAVFREAYRVLKPGGRIAVSDICLTQPLPKSVAANLAAYVGCIAGASLLDDYLDMMRKAGFAMVQAKTRRAFDVLACDDPIVLAAVEGLNEDAVQDVDAVDLVKNAIVSATVVAFKGYDVD
jgi:arsenite methyltransferase